MINAYENVNEAYVEIISDIMAYGKNIDSRNGKTLEIHPYVYTIEDFSNYILSVNGRVLNFPFALSELIWIMAGDDSELPAYYNKQMYEYMNDRINGKYLNAAYGKRMRSAFRIDQFENVIDCFKDDEDTRQAHIIYADPYGDRSRASDELRENILDRACNISSLFLKRNGKLDITQTVRSHDAIWGSPYNFIQFGYITQALSEKLSIPMGSYTELSNSLHIYEKHWEEAKHIVPMNMNEICESYNNTLPEIGTVNYELLIACEYAIRCSKHISDEVDKYVDFIIKDWCQFQKFWRDGLLVLLAYWHRDNMEDTLKILDKVDHVIFRLTMLRYLCHYNKKWKERIEDTDSILHNTLKKSTINMDMFLIWIK